MHSHSNTAANGECTGEGERECRRLLAPLVALLLPGQYARHSRLRASGSPDRRSTNNKSCAHVSSDRLTALLLYSVGSAIARVVHHSAEAMYAAVNPTTRFQRRSRCLRGIVCFFSLICFFVAAVIDKQIKPKNSRKQLVLRSQYLQ